MMDWYMNAENHAEDYEELQNLTREDEGDALADAEEFYAVWASVIM